MIELPYSLVIEATSEADYFGFYSPDLEGFSGIGHSVEDCIYKAKWGMKEHVDLLKEQGLHVPPVNPDPRITVQNEKKPARRSPADAARHDWRTTKYHSSRKRKHAAAKQLMAKAVRAKIVDLRKRKRLPQFTKKSK